MSVKDETHGHYGSCPDHWLEWEEVAAETGFTGKSGARQCFQRALMKLAKPVLMSLQMPLTEENIMRMVNSRSFQEIVEVAMRGEE